MVDGRTGRHAPSQTLDATFLEVRNRLRPVCNDSDGVTGGDERALSVDHVTITITIGGGAKWNVAPLNSLNQAVSVGQVGVGMSSTKVGGGDAVLGGRLGKTKFADEDGTSVWTGNTVKTVKKDVEVLGMGEEIPYQAKVEDRFEELNIICDGINDLNLQRTISGFSNLREVNLRIESQSGCSQGYAWGRTGSSWIILYSEMVLVLS